MLDNLTTTIVMVSLLRGMIPEKEVRWPLVAGVVLAANAGGAWSPIGDLTTTMLWLGGQITTVGIVKSLIIPSFVCFVVPVLILSRSVSPAPLTRVEDRKDSAITVPIWERRLVFLGNAALVFVPVFKTLTHLPPYMGILLGLGVMWGVTAFLHKNKSSEFKKAVTVNAVLRKVDVPSVLFFLGILLAVAGLQTLGQLDIVAQFLQDKLGNIYAINGTIGVLSSVVDNVPLVAAALKMYPIAEVGTYAVDGTFWELLALAAGTGGSCLIIGSAAGVAAMGIEKMSFGWYLKVASLPALVGLAAGLGTYALMFG